MMLENFVSKVDGQVVSSDGVPGNAGQPVQLIAEWCKYIGLPFLWSTPGYWLEDNDWGDFQSHWNAVKYRSMILATGSANPLPGDIIVFSENLPGSGGDGHASIFIRSTGEDSWEGLDALWGGKSAHKQSHTWAYVVGWFTPKNRAVLEAPTPTPIADESPYAPFDMQIIGAKIVTALRQPTTLYNLNDVSYDSFLQNPVSHVPMGFEITVTAVAKHRLGGTYYMPDSQKAEGYLLEDCEDYETVTPADEPDSEATAPKNTMPAAFSPLSAPNMNDTIAVNKRIPYYNSMSNALNRVQECGTIAPTTYYVYKRVPSGMLSITSNPGQSMRTWINPGDLKDPEPAAPFSWDKELVTYLHTKYYVATEEGMVNDLDGKLKPIAIHKDQLIAISGEIVPKNNIPTLLVPETTRKAGQHYVVSSKILEETEKPIKKVKIQTPIMDNYPELPRNHNIISLQPRRLARLSPLPELPLSAKLYLWIKERFKQTS